MSFHTRPPADRPGRRRATRGPACVRTVSPPAAVEFAIASTTYTNAVALGDVDGDGDGELVVGTAEGELVVYKGTQQWLACSGLSTITAVTVGDVRNAGRPAIVCATAEGVCLVFEPSSQPSSSAASALRRGSGGSAGEVSLTSQSTADVAMGVSTSLTPVHRQRVPVNTKVLIVADLGGGVNCLMVGRTDRKVMCFKWSVDETTLLPMWEIDFPGQIGSLSRVRGPDGPLLAVSQPGGSLLLVDGQGVTSEASMAPPSGVVFADRGLSTEVVGEVNGPREEDGAGPRPNLTALCTSSGLIKVGTTDREIWQVPVDRRLFALAAVDVTGDHVDELVACAWDGYTCVVDHAGNVVEYEFGRELCAFTSGYYAVVPGKNEPVFVYATLLHPETNHCTVSIRHSLNIRSVGAHRLPSTLPAFITDNADAITAQGIDVSAPTQAVYARILAAEASITKRHAELRAQLLAKHAELSIESAPPTTSSDTAASDSSQH